MQFKLRDFLNKIRSLRNEIKMCRICTSNVSCDSGEMVSGATGGEFAQPPVGPTPCNDLTVTYVFRGNF